MGSAHHGGPVVLRRVISFVLCGRLGWLSHLLSAHKYTV